MPSLFLAVILAAAAPAAVQPSPVLTAPVQTAPLELEDMEKLRCAAAFALAAGREKRQDPSPFPALGERAQAYFLQATTEVMDNAGLSPEALAERIQGLAHALAQPGRLEAAMPSCLASLEQSGL